MKLIYILCFILSISDSYAGRDRDIAIKKGKSVGYTFEDKQSNIVYVILLGGAQAKESTKGYHPIAEKFSDRDFSTARVYSELDPLTRYSKKQNNLPHLKTPPVFLRIGEGDKLGWSQHFKSMKKKTCELG